MSLCRKLAGSVGAWRLHVRGVGRGGKCVWEGRHGPNHLNKCEWHPDCHRELRERSRVGASRTHLCYSSSGWSAAGTLVGRRPRDGVCSGQAYLFPVADVTRWPQAWCLKTTGMYSQVVLEARPPKSRCPQGHVLSGGSGGECIACSCFWWHQVFFGLGQHRANLCMCLHMDCPLCVCDLSAFLL